MRGVSVTKNMDDLSNKPRVFLSHSVKDKPFIEKLAASLRKCQIEPWLDTEEIRDGKPWQKVIFEYGIPACDAIIVYFTENSVQSRMVEKEMDVGLLQEMSESGIRFLPYVNKANIRDRLRSDIRILHCREFNDSNFNETLPSVVAEIWRSYAEHATSKAVLFEKNRRLELEIKVGELESAVARGIFTESENSEFSFILSKLDREIGIGFDVWRGHSPGKKEEREGVDRFVVNFLDLYCAVIGEGYNYITSRSFSNVLSKILTEEGHPDRKGYNKARYGNSSLDENIYLELRTYGLVNNSRVIDSSAGFRDKLEFSEKSYRFVYWLETNEKRPQEVRFRILNDQDEDN
jgi:hypothetical protein